MKRRASSGSITASLGKSKDDTNVEIEVAEADKYIHDEKIYTPEEYARLRRKFDWCVHKSTAGPG